MLNPNENTKPIPFGLDSNNISAVASIPSEPLPELSPTWQAVVVSYEDLEAYFNNAEE